MRAASILSYCLVVTAIGCNAAPGVVGSSAEEPGGGITSTGWVTVKTDSGERKVIYRKEGNRLLAGHDAVIGELGRNVTVSTSPDSHAVNVTASIHRWPIVSGRITVPYRYDSAISSNPTLLDAVSRAINNWNGLAKWTSGTQFVYFKPLDTEPNYITLKLGTSDSPIGQTGSGEQFCYVGNNPTTSAADQRYVMHQLGHALGLFHEQQRSDRSYFVQYAPDLVGGDTTSALPAAGTTTDFGLFDFQSLMLMSSADVQGSTWNNYPEDAFLQTNGLPVAANQSAALSKGDIFGLHEAYFGDSSYQGDVVVSLSTGGRFKPDGHTAIPGGQGFAPPRKVHDNAIGSQEFITDVNGDHFADIVINSFGNIGVILSDGYGFDPTVTWFSSLCDPSSNACFIMDANKDGKADVVALPNNGSPVMVALENGLTAGAPSFAPLTSAGVGCPVVANSRCFIADTTGDGFADLVQVLTYPSNGTTFAGQGSSTTYSLSSTGSGSNTFYAPGFSASLSSVVVKFVDYNMDGKADPIVYDPANHNVSWYTSPNVLLYGTLWSLGSNRMIWASYGGSGDVFDVGDVTGDGNVDLVLFTPGFFGNVFVAHGTGSTFLEDNTTQPYTSPFDEMPNVAFAQSGQAFAVGDFNFDGKADIAKFNNGRTSSP